MAIARIFDAPGWTPDQYDSLIARMQLGGRSAPGVLFHWAAQTATGMKAVDVYESRAAADQMVQEQIGPIAAELGLPAPEISEFEVRATLSPLGLPDNVRRPDGLLQMSRPPPFVSLVSQFPLPGPTLRRRDRPALGVHAAHGGRRDGTSRTLDNHRRLGLLGRRAASPVLCLSRAGTSVPAEGVVFVSVPPIGRGQ
jgi:hypothetical protein